jgi:hypothetical protein
MTATSRRNDRHRYSSSERLFQSFVDQRFVKLLQLCWFYENITQDWNRSSRDVLNFITSYSKDVPAMGMRQQRPENDILNDKFRRYLGI